MKSYGFAGRERAIGGTPKVQAAGTRLTYQWDAAVQEWWMNDARGLEHGFTVKERPELREVLDCGSPLPLSEADGFSTRSSQTSHSLRPGQKRQRTLCITHNFIIVQQRLMQFMAGCLTTTHPRSPRPNPPVPIGPLTNSPPPRCRTSAGSSGSSFSPPTSPNSPPPLFPKPAAPGPKPKRPAASWTPTR